MYRKGHFGILLTVWSLVAFPLTAIGYPEVAVLALFVMLWFEPIPDYDLRVPFFSHRGVSHTIWTPLFLGAAFAGLLWWTETEFGLAATWLSHLGWVTASPLNLAVTGGAFATLGAFTHLVGDVLTPMGLPILWPYSDENYSIGVTTAKSELGNTILLIIGGVIGSGAFYHLYSTLR